MGLPVSQRRILERIENALLGSDPRLAALFSIFTRLNRDEEMPRVEEIRARAAIILARVWFRIAAFGRWLGAPRRAKLRAALFFPVALAIVATAVLVGGSLRVESGVGAGTTVRVRIPMGATEEGRDRG